MDELNIRRQSEGMVNLLQQRGMGNEIVNSNLLRCIKVDDLGTSVSCSSPNRDVGRNASTLGLPSEACTQSDVVIGPLRTAAIDAYGDGSRLDWASAVSHMSAVSTILFTTMRAITVDEPHRHKAYLSGLRAIRTSGARGAET